MEVGILQTAALILMLSALVEGLIEYFIGLLLEPLNQGDGNREVFAQKLDVYQLLMRYSAAAAAIGLCFSYGVDLMAQVGLHGPAFVGYIATGLLIGRGSNYVHDFISRWLTPPSP
jgi:hypothetical protein